MRRTPILLWSLVAVLLLSGTAEAAPGDPYVVYTANTFVDGAVILRTDPANGSLVEISRNGPQGTLFKRPYDLALEPDGDIVVADMGTPNAKDGSVIRVDPLTGRQSLVSSGGYFFDPAGIAVAPNGDIYVVDNMAPDNAGAVIRVDPRTGGQTLVSQSNSPVPLDKDFDLPFGIAIDHDGSLVVANRTTPGSAPLTCLVPLGKVIRVDPATGQRTLVSKLANLEWPLGVAIDANRGMVVANECAGAAGLVRLDPLSLVQSIITANGSDDVLGTPERVAFDPAGNILVSDYGLGSDGDGGIVKVDPATHGQSLLQGGDLFNHPLGIAAVVNHPPTAELTLSPGRVAAGRTVHLDGSGSRDPDGQRLVYQWDLNGDGSFEASSGTSPAVNETFSRDGQRTIRLRVDDPHGGTSVASAALTVDGRMPVITHVRAGASVLALRRTRGRHHPPTSTLLRFKMSEPGTVSVEVKLGRDGRRAGRACRPHAKRGRRCVTWSRARLVRHLVKAGSNSIRLRARGLRPGRYRVVLAARDQVGNGSAPRSLPLRIVRR